MPKIKRKLKLIILFSLAIVHVSSAQTISPLISGLNQHVREIKSFDSEVDSDVVPISEILNTSSAEEIQK